MTKDSACPLSSLMACTRSTGQEAGKINIHKIEMSITESERGRKRASHGKTTVEEEYRNKTGKKRRIEQTPEVQKRTACVGQADAGARIESSGVIPLPPSATAERKTHLLSWGWTASLPGCREQTRWSHWPQSSLRTCWPLLGTCRCFSCTGFSCSRTSLIPMMKINRRRCHTCIQSYSGGVFLSELSAPTGEFSINTLPANAVFNLNLIKQTNRSILVKNNRQ